MRNVTLHRKEKRIEVSKQETIMDFALEYCKQNKFNIKALKMINFIRLNYLRCELLGMNGRTVTAACTEIETKSQIR